ncbi:glycosyltransferase [Maribacter sp. TH_r10]|uniref:glycosyltransferase family 2 protein n=1 Tax=Maribacter sp. TH_r10 TaxID=3082086 RepID=UPI0029556696|nr:glycosyltransferase [Maribacter sp. TH_r10]MDV7140119.1 glycosyltransferase [Maribacter sp. TH_r10]
MTIDRSIKEIKPKNQLLPDKPLVSIIVVTYNSAKYVLETLESAKDQTYTHCELIITDDGSKDDTLQICSHWLAENKDNFVRTELIRVEKNSGIPANCNRGLKAAQGSWIKLIAGDDMLLPTCISDCLAYTNENNVAVLAGQMQPFSVDSNGTEKLHPLLPLGQFIPFFALNANQQNKYLLKGSFNFAPTVFFNKAILDEVEGFDERYRFFEDLPMWLKLTSRGHKINYNNTCLVKYRINHDSMVNREKDFYNPTFMQCMWDFRKTYVYPKIGFWNILYYQEELVFWCKYLIIIHLLKNKRNNLTKRIDKYSFYFILNSYINKIKKILK